MTDRRRQLFARLALVVFVVVAALRLATLDYGAKISTNVLDLIPADEREPELHLLRTLANEQQARVVLLALSAPDAPPVAAADVFMDSLRADPAFAEVAPANDESGRNALGRFFFERSTTYLLPGWIARHRETFDATGRPAAEWTAWLAETTAAELDAFLARPESEAFQDLIPSDPLLLLPGLAGSAQSLGDSASAGNHALVWSRLAASPLEDAGQQPAFDAIDRALAATRAITPGVTLEWTGVNRFAAASKARIRAEISLLNTLSIAAVLLVSFALIRRPWRVLHLLPVILCSLAGAWVTVTLVFERLHILVFVIGALLTGAAIDYGFHLFLHARAGDAEEPYGVRVRPVLKPLLLSCFTTIAGFSLLLLSELPLIRHLGVFVASGLVTAMGAALLYHAQFTGRPFEPRVLPSLPSGRRATGLWKLLLAAGLAVALGGPWLLKWHDDIRELEVPTPELDAIDVRVNALFGDESNRSVYLTGGDDIADARDRLDEFARWHRQTFPGATLAGAASMLPAPGDVAAQPERLRELSGFVDELKPALRRHGYLPEAFAPFYNSWDRTRTTPLPDYGELVAGLRPLLTGPMSMLISEAEGRVWFASIADHPPGTEPPPELQTVGTNQLRTLNRLFSRYRASALNLSLIGMGVTGLSVVLLYGPRRGLRIYAIPVGACFFTFGVLGLCGSTLNLFHLLGAFLGVCLSHDYAIFAAETREPGEPPPASIRLSALTTVASFGVLAFSRIAVISALGTTVGLTIVAALIAVEIDTALRARRAA